MKVYKEPNFAKMHFRMADYSIMLQREHDLPAKQFVIYVGPGKTTMPTTIKTDDLQFRYNLISLSSVDYKLFLKSGNLEERMLAILGNMHKDEQLVVLEKVLVDIKQTATDSLSIDRYVQQLHVLVKLRNLGQNLEEAMMTISKYFKEEEDFLYRVGQKKGRSEERARAKAVIARAEEKAEKEKKELIQQKDRELARQMLADKEPIDKIIRYTKLRIKDIKAL